MKKRLSFSQLTALSLVLLPTQQINTSEPISPKSSNHTATTSTTTAVAQQSSGWLGGVFGFGSNSKQLSPEEHLEATILSFAGSEQLYNEETGIHPDLLKKYSNETLAGAFAKLTRLNGEESSTDLENMQKEILAQQKALEQKYAEKTKALKQLLHATTVTGFASPALFRNAQAKRKSHEAMVNQIAVELLRFGQTFANNSKDARDLMDAALHSAKGTMAEMKRSVSPKHKNTGQYAAQILGIKKEIQKAEQPK